MLSFSYLIVYVQLQDNHVEKCCSSMVLGVSLYDYHQGIKYLCLCNNVIGHCEAYDSMNLVRILTGHMKLVWSAVYCWIVQSLKDMKMGQIVVKVREIYEISKYMPRSDNMIF